MVLIVKRSPEQTEGRKTTSFLKLINIIWVLATFITVAIATAGLNNTCRDFSSSGVECWVTFDAGFFDDESKKVLYRKNLKTVQAAIAFGWIAVIVWLGILWCFFKSTSSGIKRSFFNRSSSRASYNSAREVVYYQDNEDSVGNKGKTNQAVREE